VTGQQNCDWGHVIEQPIELSDDRMAKHTKRRSVISRDLWMIMDLRRCIPAPLETREMEKFHGKLYSLWQSWLYENPKLYD
jgi:hypothetical protein